MATVQIDILEIPHGHGLSFKKGVADGLLDTSSHESEIHETHLASYKRGIAVGADLKEKIAGQVKA
jgi:hypothetical protein